MIYITMYNAAVRLRHSVLSTRLIQTKERDYWSSSTCRYFFSSRFSFSVMGGRS